MGLTRIYIFLAFIQERCAPTAFWISSVCHPPLFSPVSVCLYTVCGCWVCAVDARLATVGVCGGVVDNDLLFGIGEDHFEEKCLAYLSGPGALRVLTERV